ncbi:FkbM family methyltransferase [uncultured Litoreibacter sp.]|uniref:FkbM family methyltransferase n=1 Tax=uncultured Litoreibacter sp. TaxID=1392394 RepID=UPI00263792D6|nr:FkbM family methyltransferase [uncultured Litoreibacter sp.]
MKRRIKTFGKLVYLALTGGASRTRFPIHGVTVDIPADVDTRIRFFIARNRYENTEAALIRQHVVSGETVIELGGALGVISKVIRDQIGPEGTHVVVEPNPAIFDICTKNAGSGERTHMRRAAIGYGVDEVVLQQDASLLDNRVVEGAAAGANSFSVPTTSLKELHQLVGGRFTLICDIEGMEGDLVAQDAETFAHCDKIIMEVHPQFLEQRGTSLETMIGQLEAMGFKQVSLEKWALYMTR